MTKALVGEKLGRSSYVGRDALAVAGRRDCHVYAVGGGAYSLCFRNGLLARVDPVAPALGEASIPR